MCKVFDTFFLKSYLKNKTKFLAKSQKAKDFLTNKGVLFGNVCAIGVGIDAQMLTSGAQNCEEKIYLQMKKDADKLKILYIGRFEERRNIKLIFDVFSKVKHFQQNAKLYMVGTGESCYMDKMFDYARTLDIQDNIIWQERIEQRHLSKIYEMADFFLLPTEYEIFGMVLLEAMYYQTVVLTTSNGGSSTLIQDSINGIIMDQKDAQMWAEQIISIFLNTEKMHVMQQNAAKTVKESYTWDMLAFQFINEYESLLCRGKLK